LLASIASQSFATGNHADGHADTDAIGKPGKAADAKRTITVNMLDSMRFTPQSITVKQGETIKFIVKKILAR
jgi:uncharacterized cupredoxin-like copper-binding protein